MEPVEDTVGAKVGAMVVLGGTALGCTLVPLAVARRSRPAATHQLLRFGGGVLLATTFLHLLPELREAFEDLQLPDLPIALPELLVCLGFFLMYFIEEMAHMLIGGVQGGHADTEHFCQDSEKKRLCDDHNLSSVWLRGTPLRAVMITVAISVHQVFEGLAVGLEAHCSQVWILTGAIAAHKAVIALCIGAELARSPPSGAAALVAMFTLATPLGIGLGLLLTGGGALGPMAVVLQGLAAGTLVFVVFFEVLRPEGHASLPNYIATLVGFIAMLILLYFFES